MEILGIKFAPLNVPLHRRLETLAAAAIIVTVLFGSPIGVYLLIYLLFYSNYWPIAVIYLIWTYIIDRDSCERGGRRIEWVRGWTWFKYVKNYFPIRMERLPSVELDPKKNYLFCCFPHAILPLGLYASIGSTHGDFLKLFPHHKVYAAALRQLFYIPVVRDLYLAIGCCSATPRSLNWILGYPDGGQVVALIVGGAAEALNCRPGQYRIVLKKRKGFVKLALRQGTPLVPVFAFGETDIFDQLDNPEGSLVRRIQEWTKRLTGIAPTVPLGRGLFQYSFGIVPFRKPVTCLVGKPIEVVKTEHPTQEQIDNLHSKFIEKLTELFEEQKYKYLPNPEEAFLEID